MTDPVRKHQPFEYDADPLRLLDDPLLVPSSITDEKFIAALVAEVTRARTLHPCAGNPLMAALSEEVGEVSKALMEEPWHRVFEEAVQVAAMAMRIAVEGDQTLIEYRRRAR